VDGRLLITAFYPTDPVDSRGMHVLALQNVSKRDIAATNGAAGARLRDPCASQAAKMLFSGPGPD